MNNQAKEVENTESESEKFLNIVDSSAIEANLSPHFIKQLYELTKKSIETSDETTQTPNAHEMIQILPQESLPSDPDSINQENDVCYQIIADIFLFFKRRFSIPSILNAIHQCAGDIPTALQKLNHSIPKGEEPCNFSYHKITGTKEQIDAYFAF